MRRTLVRWMAALLSLMIALSCGFALAEGADGADAASDANAAEGQLVAEDLPVVEDESAAEDESLDAQLPAASGESYRREVELPAAEYATLDEGSRGEDVKRLQQALIDRGFLGGRADGIFGAGTAKGVAAYQESEGLEPTGVADADMQRKLYDDPGAETVVITLTGTWQTEHLRVEGLFVDESAVNEERAGQVKLYIFYTVVAGGEDLLVDSRDSELAIGDRRTYATGHISGSCVYMPGYYYSNRRERVDAGDELKVVETVWVPKRELAAGRTLSFSNGDVPDGGAIALMTDDVVYLSDAEKIARVMDPEGCAEVQSKLQEADKETKAKVEKAFKEYYWTFYVNSVSYRIEFFPGKGTYKLTANSGAETEGVYTVCNGYIVLEDSDTGAVYYVSYELDGSTFDGDFDDAFDVNRN